MIARLLCALVAIRSDALSMHPRRAVLSGAFSGAIASPALALVEGVEMPSYSSPSAAAPSAAPAAELSFGEKAKAEGRARAAARKAEADAVKAKLATLGGVEGQVSTPGGVTAVETLTAADLNPIKMKREPDRRGEDAPEPGILADLPTIKFQMKRAPGTEDSDSPQVLKMKR